MGKKDSPKTGGRKKGRPNKRTEELKEISDRLGVDPFEVLLLFASGDWKALGYDKAKFVSGINEYGQWYKWTIDPSLRSRAAAEACQYLNPKRKAIEHSGEIKSPQSELSDAELDRRIQSFLKEKK